MQHLYTQFGAEQASGIGALGINLGSFIIQLITFGLAFIVLKKFAFKPILAVLQQRRDTIEQGVRLGEEMQEEKRKLDAEVQKKLRDARREADAIVAQADDAAKERSRAAEDKARAKADAIVADAQVRIDQEAKQVRKELEKELVGLISDATEAIIDEKVDAKKDAALINKALKESA